MLPKITVLITVFNGEKYLNECIDSVLNQSFEDFEFLIIDDKSTDGSLKIIKSYADKKIRIIENHKNFGQVKSLNIGLDSARGEYVARLDQDDVMIKDRLAKQLDFLRKNPDVSAVGTWARVIDEQGSVFKRSCPPARNEQMLANVFFVCYYLIHPSVTFRKDT